LVQEVLVKTKLMVVMVVLPLLEHLFPLLVVVVVM
jgi:hypothetical protein